MADPNVVSMDDYRKIPANTDLAIGQALHSGGGGGTFDGMEARVAKLEAIAERLESTVGELRADGKRSIEALARIEGKLDGAAKASSVSEVSAKLDAKASAAAVSEMSAKLDDRPTTWRVFVIVLAIGTLLTAVNFGRGTIFPGTPTSGIQQR